MMRHLLLTSALLGASLPAMAEGMKLDVEYGHSKIDTDQGRTLGIDRLGIRFGEITALPVRLDLVGGTVLTSQKGDTASAGMTLSGNYAGLLFGTGIGDRDLSLDVELGYIYHTVNDERSGQRVDLTWHETRASLRAGMGLGPIVRTYVGARYNGIDGEQRAQGTLSFTRDFSGRDDITTLLGIVLDLGPDQYAGVEVTRGAEETVTIRVGRQFEF